MEKAPGSIFLCTSEKIGGILCAAATYEFKYKIQNPYIEISQS